MALVGEEQELVGLARGDEGVDEPGGVPEVDVLVDHAVDEQQLAPDLGRVVHNGADLVAPAPALRRQAHVLLRVEGVVAVPGRHGGAGDGAAEGLREAGQGHGRQIAAVAPPVEPDVAGFRQPFLDEPLGAGALVLSVDVSEPVLDGAFELQAPPRRPSVVQLPTTRNEKIPIKKARRMRQNKGNTPGGGD